MFLSRNISFLKYAMRKRYSSLSLLPLVLFVHDAYAESTTPVSATTETTATANTAKKTVSDNNQLYQMPTIKAQTDDSAQFGQSVLNQKSIDRYQANNVAQLLDTMPGVSSAGSPRPGGQTLNILGMGGVEDVPITLDGSTKSFDKYRQGSVFIEPEILKKVTVDKGPHNVEVGNGGFGGKVTLETKDPDDLLQPGKNVGAFLKYSYYSNNTQNTYSGAVYGRDKSHTVDGLFYFTKRDSGNVTRPDGSKFLYSAQDQNTYLGKINIYPNDENKFTINAMQSGHTGWEPWAAKRDADNQPSAADIKKYGYDEAWRRKLVDRDQKDHSYSLAYEYTPKDNPLVNVKAKIAYSKTAQHDQRIPDLKTLGALLGSESWVNYANTNVDLSNTSTIKTDTGTHKIKIGFQYQKMSQSIVMIDKNKLTSADYNYGYYTPAFMPNGSQQMYSAYIEDQYQIHNVTITPSLRFDNIINQGKKNLATIYDDESAGHDYSSKSYRGWSPRLALAWAQNDNVTWFGNVSKTWRAPRIDEQYQVQFGQATVPASSRNLKTEKMLAIRLGNQLNFDGLLNQADQLQIRTTYYRNRGNDEIFRNLSIFCEDQAINRQNGGSATSSICGSNYNHSNYRNITGYLIQGYELEAFYNHPYYFAGVTLSTLKGQRDNSPINPWFNQKTWIEEIPSRKATATLGFNVPSQYLTIGWRGVFTDKHTRSIADTDTSTGAAAWKLPQTPGYSLHSIFADWQPAGPKGPQINFSIDNLFNKDYKMYLGEYMTGTGRDYKISVSQMF